MAFDSVNKATCPYCVEELIGLRIRCATCKDFDLCLQCFSAGAEIGTHKSDHPYQFVDGSGTAVMPSLNRSKWSAKEDIKLITLIESHGFDKWPEIAKHIHERSAEELHEEYYRRFVDGNIGRITWKRAYEKREKMVDLSKGEPVPPPISPAIPPLDISFDEAALLGCTPLRDDFEKEYDNEAEELLSPQFIGSSINTDDELDLALTLAHCDMYCQRLRERYRRKSICRDYQLFSLFFSKRKTKVPKRLTGEQEVVEKLRWLAQMQTSQEHDCLIKSIQRQRDLQLRLSELLRYRLNGLTKIEELPHFDQETRPAKSSSNGIVSVPFYPGQFFPLQTDSRSEKKKIWCSIFQRKKRRKRPLFHHKKLHAPHRQPFIIAQNRARAAAAAAAATSVVPVSPSAY